MKKVLVFGASNSINSINKTFANWAASQLSDVQINLIDLNDFEMPIFGVDRQNKDGIPPQAQSFVDAIKSSDSIVISLAEHNGSYTVAFKNIIDWSTRIQKDIWQNKPILLLSTSPGQRGGKSVMEAALSAFPHWGANIISSFSLPNFNTNFQVEQGIIDQGLRTDFLKSIELF